MKRIAVVRWQLGTVDRGSLTINILTAKENRPVSRDIVQSHNVHLAKENADNRMKEALYRKVDKLLHLTNANITNEKDADARDIPRPNGWKDVQKYLDRVDSVEKGNGVYKDKKSFTTRAHVVSNAPQ